jgi:hypothetical protein
MEHPETVVYTEVFEGKDVVLANTHTNIYFLLDGWSIVLENIEKYSV